MMQSPHILVWTVALQQVPEPAWSRLGTLLDHGERVRAGRFAFERHRREYSAAHALKRLMLTAVGGMAPHSWCFETDAWGKPRVSPEVGPHFNLSHCAGLVACAVSNELELGIDVEPLDREAPLEIAKVHFTPTEQAWIAALPSPERGVAFWKVWTLKEAFIKATGRGLRQPLHDFSVAFDPLRVIFHDQTLGDSRAWHFEQRQVGSAHMLALAWRDPGRQASVALQEMQLGPLLDRFRAFSSR
ncbi:MAG: 4'-phosphopantetheinyl transferase superfamily protein [Xanthobacteraceae bacterium]